jgi:hypothetical protein
LKVEVCNALYVPNVPIHLLCPQQVAMQTGEDNDGFIVGHHGTLIYDGLVKIVHYNGKMVCPWSLLLVPPAHQ